MAQHVLRIAQLASTKQNPGLLPVSPATIWRWVAQGQFPKPFKLAPQTTVWDAKLVNDWLEQRAAETI
jgi:predicted DNA-binding transcriptional regulator AlpA